MVAPWPVFCLAAVVHVLLASASASATPPHDGAAAAVLAFTDPDRFERWSHFKDIGVPNTLTDDLNRAAIADGTCRLVEGAAYAGFRFWHDTEHVGRVLTALNATPPTANPSRFTLQAKDALATACAADDGRDDVHDDAHGAGAGLVREGGVVRAASSNSSNATFAVAERAAALDNWYRALCVPASAAPWGDASKYDPAYMPAQVAITTGLACIVACDTAGHQPSSKDMTAIAVAAVAASAAKRAMPLCAAYPEVAKRGYTPLPFAAVGSDAETLMKLTTPLLAGVCGCVKDPAEAAGSVWRHPAVVGLATALAALLVGSAAYIGIARRRGAGAGAAGERDGVIYADEDDGEDTALLRE